MVFIRTNTAKRLTTMLVLLGLVVYFVFHAMQGKHGLRARVSLKKHLSSLEQQLVVLKAEREKFENYIQLMQSRTIDPDMLDEQARRLLNLAHPSEVIIMRPKQQK